MGYRHVWTGNDLTVSIYFDDGNGNRINALGAPYDEEVDSPVLEYCFMQTASVNGHLSNQRRPETGRAFERIVVEAYQYEMDVGYFYFKKSAELNVADIFNREKCLQLDMFFYDPVSGNDQDHHWLKIAYATQFDIASDDNRNVAGSAKFAAELFS